MRAWPSLRCPNCLVPKLLWIVELESDMQHNRHLAHPPLLLHCQDRHRRHIYNVVKQKLRDHFSGCGKTRCWETHSVHRTATASRGCSEVPLLPAVSVALLRPVAKHHVPAEVVEAGELGVAHGALVNPLLAAVHVLLVT
ncbi:unnamed protein product [Ixodes pacificus]